MCTPQYKMTDVFAVAEAAEKAGEEVSLDQQSMNKAMMKRKDRNLYQSILNRQKAERQKKERLTKRKKENSAKPAAKPSAKVAKASA